MSLILTPRHGYVKVLEEPAVPGVICPSYPKRLSTWADDFNAIKCIITKVQIQLPENFQFQHALNGTIYLYTFGSRIGEAVVTGLAFGIACNDGDQCAGEGTGAAGHGIDELITFYRLNRVSVKDTPVIVALGAQTCFDGYMTGLTADVLDPKIDLYQFSLRLHVNSDSVGCT